MGLFDKVKNVANTAVKTVGSNLLDSFQSQSDTENAPTSITSGMYDAQLEKLIDIAFADGVLTEKKKKFFSKRRNPWGLI